LSDGAVCISAFHLLHFPKRYFSPFYTHF